VRLTDRPHVRSFRCECRFTIRRHRARTGRYVPGLPPWLRSVPARIVRSRRCRGASANSFSGPTPAGEVTSATDGYGFETRLTGHAARISLRLLDPKGFAMNETARQSTVQELPWAADDRPAHRLRDIANELLLQLAPDRRRGEVDPRAERIFLSREAAGGTQPISCRS
jgi:hypothetical protein